jgi:PAS domain S-box-containing protein
MVSPVDGRRKFVAVVGVGDLPLILAITRDEAEALRPWHDEMWSAAVRTLMVSILVALTIFALLRQLRRLAQGALALKQSEERYAMVMEAANEGHAEWNFGNDRLFASQKWRALHGLDHLEEPERHQGSFLSEVALHGDDESTVAQTFAAHLAGQTASVSVEYRVLLREGAWRWIHTRGRCLFDGTGHPTRLFCSATDVTERKEAEIERERLRARLQQNERLEALGTLAGGIAHDFNNILGAILGFGELAQQHADAGSVLRRYIDRVMQGGARARLLVRRILDFSRSGVIERTDVHVQAVVEEVVAMLTPTLPAEVIVEAKLDAGLSAVSGDSTQLYQVIMNLCSNAVQAIAAGASGKVSLSLYCVQVCESRILLHSDLKAGPYLCLDVQDSGMGISSEVLQRIFEPFYTTKKQGEGTGLGLSVVHGVVSDLGGAIDVVSTVGVGTTVSVWLPVSGECKPHPLQEAPRWPEGHGEVVAIVDDDRALVELAEESLANLGYEAVGFDSAESALAAFQDAPTRFDAVLTDENLSGISGTALAQALWSLRPDLPVILMSGKVDEALLTRAHEAGLGPVLRKPLTLREMSNRLSEDLRCH